MAATQLKVLLLAACVVPWFANARPKGAEREFSDYYELEPMHVVGEAIPITVFARSAADRRYATRFAHSVIEVAYTTLEKSPGSGLVILGRRGEPHPLQLLEDFIERAKGAGASPELAKIAADLDEEIGLWRERVNFEVQTEEEKRLQIDIEKLVVAFPMPLPRVAADLYLLAWKEKFDPQKVEASFAALTSESLQQSEFREFDWIFYLPPRATLNQALKEILPAAFDAAEIGFFKRFVARAAVATFKPVIKDAMEGLRRSVLYWTALKANADAFAEGDIEALGEAYLNSQLPRGKLLGGDKKQRALDATEAQKKKNAEYAKDPFVAPEPIERFDSSRFEEFLGEYGREGSPAKRFFEQDGSYYWQDGEKKPVEFQPAGETLFVSENGKATLEFLPAASPDLQKVELRRNRFRRSFDRLID